MSRSSTQIVTEPNSGRHLYGRGWLGLIPGYGLLAGVWLLTLGIFRYKDKKLVFIGLGGIFFTILLWGILYYYSFYIEAGRKNFIEPTKMSMNSLVKDIEFYKLQNGKYPDSLEILRKFDKHVRIYDPISVNASIKFYYQKLDSGYTLFSCGIDMRPFTPDDVHPDIASYKTGLINKHL